MRHVMVALVLTAATVADTGALTPAADTSAAYFAGEWTGIGERGAACYLNLGADGRGWVLVDAGAGDWMGVSVVWRNKQQALVVDQAIPMAASARLRIMPLEKFTLSSGVNQSMKLVWREPSGVCLLQRTETTADQLARAREVMTQLRPKGGKP